MFKKLRDKLAEGGNLNIGQLINVDDTAPGSSSIMEEASPPDMPGTPDRRSTGGTSSDAAILPIYNSPERSSYAPPQSDTESEVEGPVDLSQVSKDQLYGVFQRSKQKVERYKNKYAESVRAYRSLQEEKEKIQRVLTESQDKALRRINELREQADLEQKAKAHLEDNLRILLDERDEQIKVMKTKIDLLSNSEEVVKPFKEQVRQLNKTLQSKEADVIMAKELRSRAEEQSKKLQKSLEECKKEIEEMRSKICTLEELNSLTVNGDKEKIAKQIASEKKLSKKENELRKIAKKMHQLKLMVITEEEEEVEENKRGSDGLAAKIEGGVDQLLSEKQKLQETIDRMNEDLTKRDDDLRVARGQLAELEESLKNEATRKSSDLEAAAKERKILDDQKIALEGELERTKLEASELREAEVELRASLAAAEQKCSEATRDLEERTRELQRVLADRGDTKSVVASVVNDLIDMQSDSVDDTTKENDLLRQQLSDLRAENASLTQRISDAGALTESESTDDMKELERKLTAATEAQQKLIEDSDSLRAEISELKQKLETSEDRVRETSDRLHQAEVQLGAMRASHGSEVDGLKEDIEDLKTQLRNGQIELESAREQAKTVEVQMEELRVENGKLRDSSLAVQKAEDCVQESEEKIAVLNRELADVRAEVERTKEAKSIQEKELKAKLAKKEQETEAITQRWDTAQREKNCLETKMLEMENEFETKRSSLNDELRDCTLRIEKLEHQLKESPETELREKIDNLAAELEAAKAAADEAKDDAEQMKKGVEIKSQELIQMVDDLAEKGRLLKEAESRATKLEAHYKDWIKQLESKISETQESLKLCGKERNAFQENADRLDKMYLQLENQLKHVQQEGKLRVADVEARLIVEKDRMKKMETAKSKLEEQKIHLEATIKRDRDTIENLELEKSNLQEELSGKILECESWEESLKTGDERNTKTRQELKEASATIRELQAELEVKEEKLREEYLTKIQESESKSSDLQKEIQRILDDKKLIEDSVEVLKQEVYSIKESPIQQENLQLRQSLKSIEEERDRLTKESERMREELSRTSKQVELLGKEAKALRDSSGDEVDTLREQMDEYKNQAILSQERCEKLQRDFDALKKQLAEKEDGWGHDGWDESEWENKELIEEHSAAVLEVAVEESRANNNQLKASYENVETVDSLKMQLAKHQDEIRDLKGLLGLHSRSGLIADMPGPTEYEYLKNIMFDFMMGKEKQTLCKVIAAVLRFSNDQTRLVTERHESLHKVPALYHHHSNGAPSATTNSHKPR